MLHGREYKELTAIIERTAQIIGSHEGYNGQNGAGGYPATS